MWMRRSTRGELSIVARILVSTSGVAVSPIRLDFISIARNVAITPSSAAIPSVA